MNIANTILSGLKFAGGGDDEHTARVAQSQVNQANHNKLLRQDAQQLMEEFYKSGIDITSDGQGMDLGATDMLADDANKGRLLRLWNSERATGSFKDKNGKRISTEIVDFARGPGDSVIPMVLGHNGKIVPMTELRSDRDDDKVLQMDEARFNQWSNELYKNNIARAGGSFIFGGQMGKIDEYRANAFSIAGREGALNNAAIEGVVTATGGDPEATSQGLAIIADADAAGTAEIVQSMGGDPEQIAASFTPPAIQDTPVQEESMAPPIGVTPPSGPSLKPSAAIDIAAPEIERRRNLAENVSANLLDRSNVREQLTEAKNRDTKGSAALEADKRDTIARLEAREAELTELIREGEQIRSSGDMAPLEGEDKLAGNASEQPRGPTPRERLNQRAAEREATEYQEAQAALQALPANPEDDNRQQAIARRRATRAIARIDENRELNGAHDETTTGPRYEGQSLNPIGALMEQTAAKLGERPEDMHTAIQNAPANINPAQVVQEIENGAQPAESEVASVRSSMQEANITDVRQLREAELGKALEAARVIAMMTEGDMNDKRDMYAGLVNYIQTGNFGMTPNDVAQTQIDAAKEARQQSELANAPGDEVLSTATDVLKESRTQFTAGLYNTEKRGKRGREWAEPTGADKAAFDNIAIAMLDIEDAISSGRLSQAKAKATQRRLLREASRYLAADFSNRDTSWFNLGGAMSDFWSNARTNGNPLERVVVSAWSDAEKTIPKNIRFVKPNGRYVDGELSYGNFTRSMDDSMSAAVMQIITDNTRRLRGN